MMMNGNFDRTYRRGGNQSHRWRWDRRGRRWFRNRTRRWVHSLVGGGRRTWWSEIVAGDYAGDRFGVERSALRLGERGLGGGATREARVGEEWEGMTEKEKRTWDLRSGAVRDGWLTVAERRFADFESCWTDLGLGRLAPKMGWLAQVQRDKIHAYRWIFLTD